MWPEDRDRIESAIDAVARQMCEGAPTAAFKARVIARIGATQSRWRSPWVISPVTVAVIVVVAISLHHWRSGSAVTRHVDRVSESRRADNDTAPPQHEHSEERRPLRTSTQMHSSSAQTVGMTDIVISPDIAELALPSLGVETIAVDRLAQPEPLTLQHLEISSIELAPIGEGDHQ